MGKLVPRAQRWWLMDTGAKGLKLGYLFYSIRVCCCISLMLMIFLLPVFTVPGADGQIKNPFAQGHEASGTLRRFLILASFLNEFSHLFFIELGLRGSRKQRRRLLKSRLPPMQRLVPCFILVSCLFPHIVRCSRCLRGGSQSAEQPPAQIQNLCVRLCCCHGLHHLNTAWVRAVGHTESPWAALGFSF